eukprot:5802503-Prymnesium_polylepis.1
MIGRTSTHRPLQRAVVVGLLGWLGDTYVARAVGRRTRVRPVARLAAPEHRRPSCVWRSVRPSAVPANERHA